MAIKLLFLALLLLKGGHSREEGDVPLDRRDLVYLVQQLEKGVTLENATHLREEDEGVLLVNFVKGDATQREGEEEGMLVNVVKGVVVEGERIESEEEEEVVLPRDLDGLEDDISQGISEGVEESLRLFYNVTGNVTDAAETRQMPMYMFQGQYVAEPRLNRFIDGALRNMGNEVRVSSMDPIYFRVLPRGRVQERVNVPVRNKVQINKNRRNKNRGKNVRRNKIKRRRPFIGRRKREMILPEDLTKEEEGRNLGQKRKRRRQQLLRQRRKRKRLRARKRRRLLQRKRRKAGKFNFFRRKKNNKVNVINKRRQRKKNKAKAKKKKAKARIRRRRMVKKNVGGGRVEGLSRIQRDGDAEMQLFGNYTLIRSHMKIGPVELTMQFRTRKGIRRTGATLPILRVHTVTRVNHEGSEMVDYLLERPHPETIQLRGNLFPKARMIARNVFSRLFLQDSFLTQKMREKTGLALLSRPTIGNGNY